MSLRSLYLFILLLIASWCAAEVSPPSSAISKLPEVIKQEPKRLGATPKMCLETRYMVYCLEQIHYSNLPFESLDARELLKLYMSELDLNRSFFLESDFNDFCTRFASLKVYLKQQGNLYPAFEIFEAYQSRLQERFAWIMERLQQGFDFTEEGVFQPDRQQAPWPSSMAEADQLWEGRLKYELLNELLKDKADAPALQKPKGPHTEEASDFSTSSANISQPKKPFAQRLTEAKQQIQKRYKLLLESINDVEASEVQEIFLTSLAHMYDPHSTFFSSDSLEEFSIALQNSVVGIGAELAPEEGYCVVRRLLPGGPAEKSKQIQPLDYIVGVGQGMEGKIVDVIGQKLQRTVRLIRGKEGTTVRLLLQPADGDPATRKEVILTREEIKLTANLARAEVYEVPADGISLKLGIIDLPAFYGCSDTDKNQRSTTQDVEELIQKLKAAGIEGLILDLRRNGGGLLDEAISLTGLFISGGPVVQVRDASGQINEYRNATKRIAWDGPLIVLASKQSASASEIVIGALKNHKRALIIGDHSTHGKGTVQGIFEIGRSILFNRHSRSQLGAGKITVQKWYLPDGSSTQLKGVPSDIFIPSFSEYLPLAESDLPNALQWDSIQPMKWAYDKPGLALKASVSPSLMQQLSTSSQQRQDTLEEFICLRRYLERFRQQQEIKAYSLNYKTRKNEKADNRKFRENMQADLKRLSESKYPSREILLDAALAQKHANNATQEAPASIATTLSSEKDQSPPQEKGKGYDAPKDDADVPDFDIYVREGLRIMADWLAGASAPAPGQRAPGPLESRIGV